MLCAVLVATLGAAALTFEGESAQQRVRGPQPSARHEPVPVSKVAHVDARGPGGGRRTTAGEHTRESRSDESGIPDDLDEVDRRLLEQIEQGSRVLGWLEEAAAAHDVEAELVAAVAWHESRWRVDAISHAGAVGVMQVMPGTADDAVRRLEHVDRAGDLTDPRHNAEVATAYLAYLIDRYDGDERTALKAYNQGPVSVDTGGSYPGAREFADEVLSTRDVLAELGW